MCICVTDPMGRNVNALTGVMATCSSLDHTDRNPEGVADECSTNSPRDDVGESTCDSDENMTLAELQKSTTI